MPTPLGPNVFSQKLFYLSTPKLKGLGLSTHKRGGSLGIGSLTAGHETVSKSELDLIDDAIRFLTRTDQLQFEVDASTKKWFRFRFLGESGTMWPWRNDREELHRVAWWTGASEHYEFLLYGNRRHLRDQGAGPDSNPTKATWWPSESAAYDKLLNSMATAVDGKFSAPDNYNDDLVKELISTCFHPGVHRGEGLKEGVFDAIIRVDKIAHPTSGKSIVFGSPLVITQEPNPVPGVYQIDDAYCQKSPSVKVALGIAEWDGLGWSNPTWLDERQPGFSKHHEPPSALPPLPTETPVLENLLWLGQIESQEDILTLPTNPPSSPTESAPPTSHRSQWIEQWLKKMLRRNPS